MTQNTPPIFFFDDLVVGEFSDGSYPQGDGDAPYKPFRGPGHVQMQSSLKSAGRAECYFKRENQKIIFEVVDCPSYGVLRIRGFSKKS